MEIYKENIIALRNIRSLSGMNFFIPDYQRGYRWTRTQANEMLRDFCDFVSSEKQKNKVQEGYYCLQPIVVKPKTWEDGDGNMGEGYEVIDGQQRLTTLYLLLTALFSKDSRNRDGVADFKMFSIFYQTRSDSKEYLENIADDSSRGNMAYECIDFYHIYQVYETFKAELESSNDFDLDRDLVKLILKETFITPEGDDEEEDEEESEEGENKEDIARNIRVIWYEIGSDERASAEDIFTRLNIGKIPLTNAELIKALFLKESNFGTVTATKEKEQKAQQLGIALQQSKMAEEWNIIEQKLQRDDFWYFLGASSYGKEYETRIEFIFDLIADWNKDAENYHTFNYFQKQIEKAGQKKGAENVWKTVKDYFRELEYWYNDRILYHLIGFLIDCGYTIDRLMNLRGESVEDGSGAVVTVKLKKDEFIVKIEKEVGEAMSDISSLEDIKFPDPKIKKVLLLFNVLSVIENERSDIKFPFDKYKKESWDKEHIASRMDKDKQEVPNKDADRQAWIDDMLYYFTGIRNNEAKDKEGKKLEDPRLVSKWVVEAVSAYLDAEVQTIARIKDAARQEQRSRELGIIKDLLSAMELSLLNSKQRSRTGKTEEYDSLLKKLFRETRKYFEEDRISDDYKDSIGNMALLNASINRSYGNAYFAIKRMHIKDRDADGVFIPLTTKNVFMKYYSKRVDTMLLWTSEDAGEYTAAIRKKLSRFLPNTDK